MQKRKSYEDAISDFWDFENFGNLKIYSACFFYFCKKKIPQVSKFSKNRNICARLASKECMYQVSSNTLQKRCFIVFWMWKIATFQGIWVYNTMHFHIFILFQFLCNKRCSKVIFRFLDEKPTHEHVGITTPNDRNQQFDLATSDDLDLRKGHLGLRTMLRYVTDPNHVDSSAAYAFILGILRRKGNKWKMSNILCMTWPVTSGLTSKSNF